MTQPAIPGGPAPAAPTPGGEGGAPSSAPAPAWYDAAAPEFAAWAKEQNFAKPDDALAAHRGLLKLRGVPDRELLRLPEKWEENPEASSTVYARLGRPEKPDGYEIPNFPVGDGERDLAPDFKQWAHEAGLSKAQASKLATRYQAAVTAFVTERDDKSTSALVADEQALRAEWGGEYEANVAAGKRAYAAIGTAAGLSSELLDRMEMAIGHSTTMKLMALVGRTMGEHRSVGGDGGEGAQFGLTPAAALSKANALSAERQKLQRDDPRYKDISDEITRLHFVATGEQVPPWLLQKRGGA